MSIFTLLTILIFPLNFLLAFPINTPPKPVASSSLPVLENVQGAESSKPAEIKQEQIFSPDAPVPRRKDGLADLVIPTAHAAVIIDANSGTVLMDQDGTQQRQIASLTKLTTAALVLENVKNLDEDVTIDDEVTRTDGTIVGCLTSGNCTSPRLKVGESISVRSLLTAMLMNSANDAAVALGKHVSGTQDAFVDLMNEKAKELGMNNTHYCTASGLEIDGEESECYSSAYDVAKIAAYDMRFPLIWQIMKMPTDTKITSSDGTCTHDIINTDNIVNNNLIPDCIGGKTGFTPLAGASLMLAVSDASGKNKIIAVLLDDPDRWTDIKTMVKWAFASYNWE